MKKSVSNKKIASIIAVGVATVALIGAGVHMTPHADAASFASTEETANTLKVFVGDVDRAPAGYTQQRMGYVAELASADTNENVEAVIGFDDYYTVDAVIDWATEHSIDVTRVYMWPKGETGRLSIGVKGGDIWGSIEAFKTSFEENNTGDEQAASDYQRFLDGEFEIFAVTVNAPAEILEAMSAEADCINYVDVMHNESVEAYAARAHKSVTYIELPAKPDGAL